MWIISCIILVIFLLFLQICVLIMDGFKQFFSVIDTEIGAPHGNPVAQLGTFLLLYL